MALVLGIFWGGSDLLVGGVGVHCEIITVTLTRAAGRSEVNRAETKS